MARIVAFTYATPGHLFVTIPTLLELRTRGHEVVLATYQHECSDGEVAGIRACGVGIPKENEPTGAHRSVAASPDAFERSGEPATVALERFISQELPDILVIDAALWGGAVAAEASRIPWARVANNPLQFRGRGVDVRGPGLRPPRGICGRLRNTLIQAAQRRFDRRRLPVINATRLLRGLPGLGHPWDLFDTAPLTIAYTAEPFEYPRQDWPSALRFVGPSSWDSPSGRPSWFDQLDARSTILVVGSSIGRADHGADFPIAAVLRGLSHPRYQTIVSAPVDQLPQSVSEHVRVSRYVPHHLILPHVACVVCHGGAGIVHKALAAGVPVVVIPTGFDRAEIARRVEVARCGVRLPLNKVTPARVEQAVRDAIACRSGAEQIARAFRESGGPAAAATAIESLHRSRAYQQHRNIAPHAPRSIATR